LCRDQGDADAGFGIGVGQAVVAESAVEDVISGAGEDEVIQGIAGAVGVAGAIRWRISMLLAMV
jgi:hypothetical protein